MRPKLYLRTVCLFAGSLFAGCKPAEKPATEGPGTFVILVDRSASISSSYSKLYAQYLRENVFPSVTPGSHVVVELIGGKDTGNPDASSIVDQRLSHVQSFEKDWLYYFHDDVGENKVCDASRESQLKAFAADRTHVQVAAMELLHVRTSSNRTFLIDGLREASNYFQQEKRRRVLIIMSDGVEESDKFGLKTNFNNPNFWHKHASAELVSYLDPVHNLPGLRGADVYFVGLNPKAAVAREVGNFWRSFFKVARVRQAPLVRVPQYEERPTLSAAMPSSKMHSPKSVNSYLSVPDCNKERRGSR